MTDLRFEQEISRALDEGAPMRPPNHLLHTFEYNASRSRRYPRWLALIKEPTMRTDSHLAVGSPAARALAIAIATLLLAIALAAVGVTGQRLLAVDGPIVVDQSGEGDFSTIGEAIEAATEGAEITVRSGIYAEAVMIDKDLMLRGEGDVVVQAPEGGPLAPTHQQAGGKGEPYALWLSEIDGTVSGLTFRGEPSAVIVTGGSPTVEDNVFEGVGFAFGTAGISYDGSSIVLNGGTTATVRGNTLADGGPIATFGEASPIIEENVLENGPHIFLESTGPGVVVRGNTISGTLMRGIGMSSPGTTLIEGNHVSAPGGIGIRIGNNDGAEGFEPTVRGNTVEGATYGIEVTKGGAPVIEGNTLTGNGTAISALLAESDIAGNTLTDNGTGLLLGTADHAVANNSINGGRVGIGITGGAAQLSANTVEGASTRGIAIASDATPVLRDNHACGNETNVWIADTASPDIDESNEICADEAAE